ncbi:MAG: hypothetical protein IJM31_07165, partial [Campylobacter sp.]|nr:hypothetical protein [Campylobacter sp.]
MQSDRELFLEFQRKWNKEKVQNMSLEEYTGLYEGFTEPKQNVENFTYQIQGRTTKVKNKWSDSYHFGIYKYKSKIKNEKNKNKNDFMIYDDKYVWNKKYGNTAQEAFENIKSKILKIIEFSQNNELEKIDNVDLGDEFKWEIAFRYQNPDDMRILDIFNTEIIETLYKD